MAYGELENCELYPVSFEQLMSLGITCQLVKANPKSAPMLLPRQEGFFFGSSEYDDDYFAGVDDTLEIIRQVCDALQDGDELLLPRLGGRRCQNRQPSKIQNRTLLYGFGVQ